MRCSLIDFTGFQQFKISIYHTNLFARWLLK
nr:MAG TPA: hypothetical protein [Caudoviricetes sp.]